MRLTDEGEENLFFVDHELYPALMAVIALSERWASTLCLTNRMLGMFMVEMIAISGEAENQFS